MPHNFWMINCNEENYNVTRRLGFTGQGLKAEYRRKVQRVEPGDRVIYYVTGSRVFTATATVTQGYEEVGSGPWIKEGKATWPYRIGIKPDVVLENDQYISAGLIAYRLEYVRKWAPEDWYMAFQGNLHLLSKSDFFLLEGEMLKLRDGREKALEQIDAALAAEEERVSAQRERRRRNATRNNARPQPPRVPAACRMIRRLRSRLPNRLLMRMLNRRNRKPPLTWAAIADARDGIRGTAPTTGGRVPGSRRAMTTNSPRGPGPA